MGLFTRITDRMNRQSKQMGMMMQRLEVNSESLAAEAMGARLERAARTCLACRDSDECQHWLEGKGDTAPDFCPNAPLFAMHRRQ